MKKYTILTIIALIGTLIASAIKLPSSNVWMYQYVTMLFFMLAGVSLVLWDFNKFLSIFTFLCLISAFFVSKTNPRAIACLFQLDMACLVAYGVSRFNKNNRKWIIYAIVTMVGIQFTWLIVQYLNVDPFFHLKTNRALDGMVAFSGSSGQLGSFFAVTFPVLLYIHPILSIIGIIGLAVSKSSFSVASAIIAGLLYLGYVNKKIVKYLVIIALILGVLFFLKVDKVKMADFDVRYYTWKHSIISVVKGEITLENKGIRYTLNCNPWMGWGFGSFYYTIPYIPQALTGHKFNYINEKFTHAHNDFVEAFMELGYLGLISMILLFGGFFIGFIKARKNKELVLYFSCILAYLLNSCGNFLSQIAPTGLMLAVFYGLYISVRRENGASR